MARSSGGILRDAKNESLATVFHWPFFSIGHFGNPVA